MFIPFHIVSIALLSSSPVRDIEANTTYIEQSKKGTLPSPVQHFGVLPPERIAEDDRLTRKTLTLVGSRIYIAELMELWTKQTSIAFESLDTVGDDSGRFRVLVNLRKPITVVEAMNALRSLLSQQGATWKWERKGASPNFSYRLIRPASIEQLEQSQKAAVQSAYEKQWEEARNVLAMPPEQIKTNSSSDQSFIFRAIAGDINIHRGLEFFTTALSEKQQQDVLRGTPVTIRGDDVNAIGKQFISGQYGTTSLPKTVTFATSWIDIKPTPSLFILVDGRGGAFLGGTPMANIWRDKLMDQGLLEGDNEKPQSMLMTQKVMPPLDVAEDDQPASLEKLLTENQNAENSLMALANASSPKVNFLARLPQSNGIQSSMPRVYGKVFADLLKDWNNLSLATKWQKDVLLFSYTAGFAHHDTVADATPYALYRFVFDHHDKFAEARNIPLTAMVAMTKLGSQSHWQALGTEYATVFPYLLQEQLPTAYPLLSQVATQKQVDAFESEKDVRLTDLRLGLREVLPIEKGTPRATRVAFRQSQTSDHRGVVNVCRFVLLPLTASDKEITLSTFYYAIPQDRKALTQAYKARRNEDKRVQEAFRANLPPL